MDAIGLPFQPSTADCSFANQKYASSCLSAASQKINVPSCKLTRREGVKTGYWQRALEQLVRVLETTPFLFLENSQGAPNWVVQSPGRVKQTSDSPKESSSKKEFHSDSSNVQCKAQVGSGFNSSVQQPSEPECADRNQEDNGGNTLADVAPSICRVCHCEVTASEMLVLDCGCHSKGLAIMHSECALLWFSYQQTRTCEICQKPVKNLPNVLDPSLKPKKSATSRHPPRPPAEPRVPPRQDSLAERMLRCFVDLCSPDEEQSKARRRAGASSIHAPARALRV